MHRKNIADPGSAQSTQRPVSDFVGGDVRLCCLAPGTPPVHVMSPPISAWLGGVVCAVYVGGRVPHWQHESWAYAWLLFAALVLMPLALPLFEEKSEGSPAAPGSGPLLLARRLHFPAALALAVACWLPPSPLAAAAALPWVAWTGLLAVIGASRLKNDGLRRPLDGMCADAALIFSAVGGAWTLADRLAYLPLRFEPAIVALIAVHFHYAGVLLSLFAGLVQRELWFWRFAARVAVGVVLGVPAVAAGITATQLHWGTSLETAAGVGLALVGMAVGILHVRIALEAKRDGVTRALLAMAGASLFFGMLLAALYALRATATFTPWLGLPQMRMLHGTVNAFGFGLGGTLAWRRMAKGGAAPQPST